MAAMANLYLHAMGNIDIIRSLAVFTGNDGLLKFISVSRIVVSWPHLVWERMDILQAWTTWTEQSGNLTADGKRWWDGVLTFVAISGILRGSEKATATAQFSLLNATCESAHGEFYNTRASRLQQWYAQVLI